MIASGFGRTPPVVDGLVETNAFAVEIKEALLRPKQRALNWYATPITNEPKELVAGVANRYESRRWKDLWMSSTVLWLEQLRREQGSPSSYLSLDSSPPRNSPLPLVYRP